MVRRDVLVGRPSWIHIEPCAALLSPLFGRFWRMCGNYASPPSNDGLRGAREIGRNVSAPPGPTSEVNLFRDGKSVIDLNAEISDGALNLGVAEQ
jgi:hypothetical protein